MIFVLMQDRLGFDMVHTHTQTKTAMDTLNSDSYGGLRGLNEAGEEDATELEINKIIQNGLAEISTEVQLRFSVPACFCHTLYYGV
jgi:hypothetical protein